MPGMFTNLKARLFGYTDEAVTPLPVENTQPKPTPFSRPATEADLQDAFKKLKVDPANPKEAFFQNDVIIVWITSLRVGNQETRLNVHIACANPYEYRYSRVKLPANIYPDIILSEVWQTTCHQLDDHKPWLGNGRGTVIEDYIADLGKIGFEWVMV